MLLTIYADTSFLVLSRDSARPVNMDSSGIATQNRSSLECPRSPTSHLFSPQNAGAFAPNNSHPL